MYALLSKHYKSAKKQFSDFNHFDYFNFQCYSNKTPKLCLSTTETYVYFR